MFGFIKKLFGAKPVEVVAEVPYKVEETKVAAVNAQPVVAEVVKAEAPAKKKAAPKKQQFSKKPAGIKKPAGAKKPASPKKPKSKPAA